MARGPAPRAHSSMRTSFLGPVEDPTIASIFWRIWNGYWRREKRAPTAPELADWSGKNKSTVYDWLTRHNLTPSDGFDFRLSTTPGWRRHTKDPVYWTDDGATGRRWLVMPVGRRTCTCCGEFRKNFIPVGHPHFVSREAICADCLQNLLRHAPAIQFEKYNTENQHGLFVGSVEYEEGELIPTTAQIRESIGLPGVRRPRTPQAAFNAIWQHVCRHGMTPVDKAESELEEVRAVVATHMKPTLQEVIAELRPVLHWRGDEPKFLEFEPYSGSD